MQPVIERYAPRFAVLSGVSLLIVLMAWLGIALRTLERMQHPNRLSECQESYLQSCQYQLVDWRQWEAQAVVYAQRLNRPLIAEVGAYWSGRSRRLGKELFQDSGIADLINREFVPIKVDADACPKRTRYLLQLVNLMNFETRYPAIVLFTHEGTPITAIAPDTRAELMRVLEEVSRTHLNSPETLLRQAESFEQAWMRQWVRPARSIPLEQVPSPDPMEVLREPLGWQKGNRRWLNSCEWLLASAEAGDSNARTQLIGMLQELRNSPLWDTKQGGFFALTEGVDFENSPEGGKRLMEHARLLSLYARASRLEPELAGYASELLRVMRALFWQERPAGFITSVAPPRSISPLLREHDPHGRDRTLTADGNALAVIALADYLESLGADAPDHQWARDALKHTMETLRALRTPSGDLFHTSRRQSSDWLPDLALVALAGCRLQRIAPSERNLQFVRGLLERIERDYRDPTGGYYDTSQGKRWEQWVLQPVRMSVDEELPADNALVALAQLEFARVSGERTWLEKARQTLQVMAGDIDPQFPLLYTGFWRARILYQQVTRE